MDRGSKFFFAWEGASGAGGPWGQLLVLEARGKEALSTDYEYVIELALADGAAEVDCTQMLGARATLRVVTEVEPAVRLVHGILSEVEEIGVEKGMRLRVRLSPPFAKARLWKKSVIHVDKKIQDILEKTLERTSSGMAFTRSGDAREEASPEDDSYTPFKATYCFRVTDLARLQDPNARPYVVQYQESDVDFVARMLEEEGIAYHFEHTPSECVMVLSDSDLGRDNKHSMLTVGQDLLHRHVANLRLGGRLRPKAIALRDYDYRKPDHELVAGSPGLGADAHGITVEDPARYQYSTELGEPLAKAREEQFDSERTFVSLVSNCRAIAAGTLFTLDHSKAGGVYLATRVEVHLKQRASFGRHDDDPYVVRIEALRAGESGSDDLESKFRPARTTPRPRVFGTQTAMVTAEPNQDSQEINVGGEGDFGSVRVRFHWDLGERDSSEPSSCWVRVSQMFAGGRGHGAMFHPRVGDEVIVDYLEGDPDRPIITGRVYNGKNLSPENATKRPTYSCIKSMTSPFNGNYNMIAFDDLQGDEKLIVHVAKDFIANILHDSSRFVANFDKVEIKGNQWTLIHGNQEFTVLANQDITIAGNQTVGVAGNQATGVDGHQTCAVHGGQEVTIQGGQKTTIDGGQTFAVNAVRNTVISALDTTSAGALISRTAPTIYEASVTHTIDSSVVTVNGATISLLATGVVIVNAPAVVVNAPAVSVNAADATVNASGTAKVEAGTVDVKAGKVNVKGGTVDVKGGSINLNC